MNQGMQKNDKFFTKNPKKVVFIDRDGVINKDSPEYIKSWSEFEFLPGSIDAIKKLTLNGIAVIIITNQSAINRNMLSQKGLEYIHSMMCNTIASTGGCITDIFFCPHTPQDRCCCRKPKPGLLYKAQKKYRINLAGSVMVGDSAKDIECAQNAGCGYKILVKTGNGKISEKVLAKKKIFPDYLAKDLFDATDRIIEFFNKA